MNAFANALARFVTTYRALVLGIGVVFFAIFALGLGRARFSTDYRIFFSKEDTGLAAFEKLESTFTKTDNVLFVVRSNDGIFTEDGKSALEELTTEGWKLPFASRVDSLTNFQRARATDDDIVVGELGKMKLEEIKAFAMQEPLLSGSLLSKDGRTAAVNVTLRLPRTDPREVAIAADASRALVAQVQAKHPQLEIRPCGMAFMNDAFMQASLRDMGIMIPLMVIVMLGAMALILKSARATGAVAAVLFMSAATSMAIAGWLRYPLTPPAIAAPMMVLTVAVADGVHIVLATMEALSEGLDRRAAVRKSIATNFEAVTYTWLTTIVGFVCLNYSEAPPVRHLANMTCVGVTVAYVFSVTMLPAMLVGVPLKARAEGKGKLGSRLAGFVIKRRAWVLGGAAVVSLLLGWQASKLETNDQFVQYFGESLSFRRDVDFTMKNLSGIYRLEMQVGSEAGVSDPKYLERLDAFTTYLRDQPEVQHVYGLSDIAKRVHEATTGTYSIPESREAAAQDMLLYEMGLPSGLGLEDRVSVDKASSRLTITVRDMSTKEMRGLTARVEGWLKSNAPRAMQAEATGPVVIFSQLSDRNAASMVQGDFVSLVLISLCMMLVLRSVKLGLLSVIPNVIPIVIGYGIWRLAVGQMNIVASVAGSISLGVIVDDTIHFLTKYKQLAKKYDPELAMEKTLGHVGPAMLSTSLIIVVGFGVLCFSSFQMTSWLGWLSVLVVGIAPIADLILVPALVVTFSGKKKPAPSPSHVIAIEPSEATS